MEWTTEMYVAAQEKCGLQVGDRVRVMRKAESYEQGWKASWNVYMDDLVGNVYTIKCACYNRDQGFQMSDKKGRTWSLPFFVLEKVTDEPVKEPEESLAAGEYKAVFAKDGHSVAFGCTRVDFATVGKVYEHMKKLQEKPRTESLADALRRLRPDNLTAAEAAIYDRAVNKIENDAEYRHKLETDEDRNFSSASSISMLFTWSQTDEGHDFWEAIHGKRV